MTAADRRASDLDAAVDERDFDRRLRSLSPLVPPTLGCTDSRPFRVVRAAEERPREPDGD